jgi:hypothetical protein
LQAMPTMAIASSDRLFDVLILTWHKSHKQCRSCEVNDEEEKLDVLIILYMEKAPELQEMEQDKKVRCLHKADSRRRITATCRPGGSNTGNCNSRDAGPTPVPAARRVVCLCPAIVNDLVRSRKAAQAH